VCGTKLAAATPTGPVLVSAATLSASITVSAAVAQHPTCVPLQPFGPVVRLDVGDRVAFETNNGGEGGLSGCGKGGNGSI